MAERPVSNSTAESRLTEARLTESRAALAVAAPSVVLVDPARQVPAYDRALAAALARAGWRVDLATGPRVHDGVPPPDGVREELRFGKAVKSGGRLESNERRGPRLQHDRRFRRLQRLQRRWRRAAGYPFEWAGLSRSWRAAGERPTVLHAQWALLPPLEALLYRQLRRGGVPVVHTVHNVLPHEPSPAARWRWRALYANADALIVHSQATARRLRRLLDGRASADLDQDPAGVGVGVGVGPGPEPTSAPGPGRADRIHVVPMGPFPPFEGVLPSRATARAALHLPPEAPLALFFGLVRPYKGVDLLLEAWATLRQRSPEARLLVAGPVPGGAPAAAAWRRRIDGLGLGDSVLWHPGYVAEEAVSRYLAAADLVALPYRETDDSAVLALARGHGRAVLATDVGGLREALEAGGGRLVAPGHAAQLASALQEILTDPAARRRLEAEQRVAAGRWGWDEVALATIEVYRGVIEGRER